MPCVLSLNPIIQDRAPKPCCCLSLLLGFADRDPPKEEVTNNVLLNNSLLQRWAPTKLSHITTYKEKQNLLYAWNDKITFAWCIYRTFWLRLSNIYRCLNSCWIIRLFRNSVLSRKLNDGWNHQGQFCIQMTFLIVSLFSKHSNNLMMPSPCLFWNIQFLKRANVVI